MNLSTFESVRRPLTLALSLIFVLALHTACSTRAVEIVADQSDASIRAVQEDGKPSDTALGTGTVSIKDDDLANKLYRVDKPGFDPFYLFFTDNPQDFKLAVTLSPKDTQAAQELERAKSELVALRDLLQKKDSEVTTLKQSFEKDVETVALAQKHLTNNSVENAKRELEKLTDPKNAPAYAELLNGQIELLQGNRGQAIDRLKKALQRRPDFVDAKRLLEALEK